MRIKTSCDKKIMGRFYVFPIFIATFVPRRETLTATRSKAQK